jgi:hypothetical protein
MKTNLSLDACKQEAIEHEAVDNQIKKALDFILSDRRHSEQMTTTFFSCTK